MGTKMLSLGLDPSLSGFGWCIHSSSAEGKKRVIAKGKFKTYPKQVFVSRYMFLRDSVGGILDKYTSIEVVGVESPPFGAQFSEGLYGLFLYVNEAIYTRHKDVVYFDPITLKMLVKQNSEVRKGDMAKGDMVQAAKDDTGILAKWDHNEADAYHVARFAARFFEYQSGALQNEDLTPSEFQSFARTHTYTRGKKAGTTDRKGLIYRENDRFFKFSKLTKESK